MIQTSRLLRAAAVLLPLAACATKAPGVATMVKPAEFPITVVPDVASTDGSVFPGIALRAPAGLAAGRSGHHQHRH
jgi:hypothetical protein